MSKATSVLWYRIVRNTAQNLKLEIWFKEGPPQSLREVDTKKSTAVCQVNYLESNSK